ncbi:MAG: CpsB/CapC family capsule biosynthesis tyrosine phosphatase [Reichenbachiella sp.]|uniref:tyrosine-protein phosphatase n=1 Tax=Reichenbachiella sp. TaxID=2184521 RepID=UPI0032672C4F
MFNWHRPKTNFLQTDLHSHLIPGIDDGVNSWEEAIDILRQLSELGYKKVVTTPHIIQSYYPNTPNQIREGVVKLNQLIKNENLPITIEGGAEYLVDEHFRNKLGQDEELLTFGDNYILIETPFMNKPAFLDDVIFSLQSDGLKPILAHPERYTYLQNDFEEVKKLVDNGTLLQINISSLIGYYSKEAKRLAGELIKYNLVSFLGSDIHNQKHLTQVQKSINSKLFQKCRQLDLLNSSL